MLKDQYLFFYLLKFYRLLTFLTKSIRHQSFKFIAITRADFNPCCPFPHSGHYEYEYYVYYTVYCSLYYKKSLPAHSNVCNVIDMDYRVILKLKRVNHFLLLPLAQASDTGHFSCLRRACFDKFSLHLFTSHLLMKLSICCKSF